jgi:hypothetical protein
MKQQVLKSDKTKMMFKNFSYVNLPGIFFLVSIPGYFIYSLAVTTIADNLLASSSIATKAVVTRRLFSTWDVSPSYTFQVNGRTYTGSQDMERSIGDSVEIEYAANYPYFNRVITSR